MTQLIIVLAVPIAALFALCFLVWLDEHWPRWAQHSERMVKRISR